MAKVADGSVGLQGKRVCFFAKLRDASLLDRNEFYRVDLNILRDLGLKTTVALNPLNIPAADVYVVWWWTWAFMPILRAKLIGKPVVVVGTFDHVLPEGRFEYFPKRNPIHKALIRWSLRNADANIVCAEDMRSLMEKTFTVNNLSVSPHVIDTERYKPVGGEREPLFITVCWMRNENAKRKCVATSIRAMATAKQSLPGHKLLIVGEKGEGYPELAKLVDELGAGDVVQFTGVVTVEEKISLLRRATAYLQPTLAEGFGVAILEAMSCGTPVIVSPVGAVPEVVGDVAPFVDGHDYVSLAAEMVKLAEDSNQMKALGERCRARAVEKFSYARRLADFRTVIEQAINHSA